jgi:hypothetical protein
MVLAIPGATSVFTRNVVVDDRPRARCVPGLSPRLPPTCRTRGWPVAIARQVRAAKVTAMNTHLLAAGAVIAALAATPAVASADTSLIGGPLKVRDYQMTVIGSDGPQDTLTVMLSRTSGGDTQQHMYSFDDGVTVTPTSISGSLGRFGAVKLKLTGARAAKGSVPKGCTGTTGTTRSGTLTGSFKLVADTTYFRTITAKKLKGTASSGGSLRCDTPGSPSGTTGTPGTEPTLSVSKTDGGAMFSFSATPEAQSVLQMDDEATTAPASIMHMISTTGTGLKLVGGINASVPGQAPFITGAGDFTASGEASGGFASGTLGGDLVAAFDSIGSIPVAGDAMLMNAG